MTLDEFIAFLEPAPGRAGAICQSAEDYGKQKTALEQACKSLGRRCSYDLKQTIRSMRR